MKPFKRKIITGMGLAVLFCLSACGGKTPPAGGALPLLSGSPAPSVSALPPGETPVTVQPQEAAIGDGVPVTRGMAAKMLALMRYDKTTIQSLDYEITFADVPPGSWYAMYVNAACSQGLMAGAENGFRPEEPLTLGQAHELLLRLNPSRQPGIELTDDNRDKPVSYALWAALYKKLLEGASDGETIYDAFGIESAQFVVLATAGNQPALSEGQMIADTGAFTHEGLNLDEYIDQEIRVFHKNKEIIAMVEVTDDTPTIRNVYISEAGPEGLRIFSGGAQRYYAYENGNGENIPDGVGDVSLSNGKITAVEVFPEIITGTILKTTGQSVELKEYGVLPAGASFKVYGLTDGQLKWRNFTNLLSGTDMAEFYIKDGILRAGVITKAVKPEKIRVVIGNSHFAGLVHKTISVTSEGPFTVRAGDREIRCEAGQPFSVSDIENADLFGQPRLYITPEKNNTLQLTGLGRNWPGGASPRYRGVIEIAKETTGGGYSVVNEVALEEYLYAVVPSEMPSGHGAEASKAQAVTARSYAYNQYFANQYHEYAAQVDDSVMSQVYNNLPENEVSIEAVDATRGRCLTYQGRVISANFFSTSSGYTANNGEVWASPAQGFPQPTDEYLRSKPQGIDAAAYGDVSAEENAARFFKATGLEAYDSGFSWFRWNVRMTAAELAVSINENLYARWQAAPALIKTWQPAENAYRSRPVETIGDLVSITVIRRGQGGNIMEMRLEGTEAIVLAATEYNIRMLLRPMSYGENERDIVLNLANGSQNINYALMPSAFFTFDTETDESGRLTAVTFYGGGNGHGAGMSQNGVKGMIDRGFSFDEILDHYYPGTEIQKMY